MILKDPPRNKNLVCARRGCDKKLQPPSSYAGRHGLVDPFCSRTCCEAYYGVVDRLASAA